MSANILQLREVKVAGIRFRDVGDAANALEVTVNVYFIEHKRPSYVIGLHVANPERDRL